MFIEKIPDNEKLLIDTLRHEGMRDEDGDEIYPENSYTSCENFLHYWEYNKREMMSKVFKDQLILKKKITVSMENDELIENMKQFVFSEQFISFKRSVYRMLSKNNNLAVLAEPEERSYCFAPDIRNYLDSHLFSAFSLIDNKYTGRNFEFKLPDGSIFKLNKGSKIMKTLGRFAKIMHNEEVFENIRIRQSQVMNEAQISANLCLSIHPLDYMTASYNSNGWESCMHWLYGDYRRGVIEMMNSPYVVVAYLESNHETLNFKVNREYPNEKWNSKKWREFIIVSDLGIFGIKGYPYWNPQIEKIALEWLRDLYVEQGIFYSNKVVSWQSEGDNPYVKDSSVSSEFTINMNCGPAMYNDFYSGNNYQAILAKEISGEYTIDYSGESECVVCGDIESDEPHDLACSDCIKHTYCFCCGEEITCHDDLIDFGDRIYCRYCYENRLPVCDVCGETLDVSDEDFIPEDGIQFYVNDKNFSDIFIRDSYGYLISRTVCNCCAEDVFVDGEDELYKEHNIYTNWCLDNPKRHIIPIQNIRNINLLEYYEDDLKKFKMKIKSAQVEKKVKSLFIAPAQEASSSCKYKEIGKIGEYTVFEKVENKNNESNCA